MARYKKISWNEYKNLGDIIVIATYPKSNQAKKFCNALLENHLNVVSFNLRESLKSELEEELQNKNNLTSFIYIDDTASSDIEYIKEKCLEIKMPIKRFTLILDFEKQVHYTKQELEELKELSVNFKIPVIITTDLSESVNDKKYPTVEDLNNPDLVDIADNIFLANEKKADKIVLAKNNFGKVGLLNND